MKNWRISREFSKKIETAEVKTGFWMVGEVDVLSGTGRIGRTQSAANHLLNLMNQSLSFGEQPWGLFTDGHHGIRAFQKYCGQSGGSRGDAETAVASGEQSSCSQKCSGGNVLVPGIGRSFRSLLPRIHARPDRNGPRLRARRRWSRRGKHGFGATRLIAQRNSVGIRDGNGNHRDSPFRQK